MAENETKKTIYRKISEVRMALLKAGIGKDKKAFNYAYIDLPQIEALITEECAKVGILTMVDFPEGKAVMRIYDLDELPTYSVNTTNLITQANNFIEISVPVRSDMVEIKGSQPIQNVGGMMTYMRRYLYMAVFAISEHDSVEGIGKASQEVAQDIEKEKEQAKQKKAEADPERTKLIEDFKKNLPDYLEKLVAYKKVKSVDDFSTEELKQVYATKMNQKTKAEATNKGEN